MDIMKSIQEFNSDIWQSFFSGFYEILLSSFAPKLTTNLET